MLPSKKRITRPAAVSAIALASLVGAPSASAQVVCTPEVCENPPSPAFLKLAELGFPGATEDVFFKFLKQETAFGKIGALGFPGNTEDVFFKI